MIDDSDPVCWRWPVGDGVMRTAAALADMVGGPAFNAARSLLAEWQQERCAICGVYPAVLGADLVTDHDHTTMLIRGLLCPSCNTCEGRTVVGDAFAKYRERPPAVILSFAVPYRDSYDLTNRVQRICGRLNEMATAGGREVPPLVSLNLVVDIRTRLDADELALIEAARDSGATWEQIGFTLGFRGNGARQAALGRHRRLTTRAADLAAELEASCR